MFAAAAAAHGQISAHLVIILAAVALAMFWRPALKAGLALLVIIVVMVIVKGDLILIHGLRALIP